MMEDHRAKDFPLRDAHLGSDVENGTLGLEGTIPCWVFAPCRGGLAAGDEFCTLLFLADGDVA